LIKGIIILANGVMAAFFWALTIIYCADNVFPQIMTMSGIVEGDPMWPAVVALEVFIVGVLLIPWIIAAYAFIGFLLRIFNIEQEQWTV
jgi:hypothetical protein